MKKKASLPELKRPSVGLDPSRPAGQTAPMKSCEERADFWVSMYAGAALGLFAFAVCYRVF